MNEQPYTKRLREMLHHMFADAKDVSNNREVTINCPLCKQDGDEDRGHHMYISLGYDNKPPMFNCFRRLGHSGILSKSALERFNGNSQYLDPQLMEEIEKSNNILSNYGTFRLIRDNKLHVNVPFSNNEQKLKYINTRLSLNLSIQEATKNKIILSLYDFLRYNRLDISRDKKMCDHLERYYVGFLTNNNMSIIMRNTITDHKLLSKGGIYGMRYYKYDVVDGGLENYYILPCSCDIYQPIDVCIAEGPFDILSICYNLYNGRRENIIYGAIGSKAYLNLIRYVYVMYGLMNVRFHIYIDSGIERYILNEIKRVIKPLCHEVYIHINMYDGEKDYGVGREKIKDHCYMI